MQAPLTVCRRFLPSAAPWALLPLVVRERLGLGAGVFGMLLGLMGVGGVASGLLLPALRGRVAPADRDSLLDAMQHVQHARGRAGALDWRLYEDVAHPEGWLEAWTMESWTDHLRAANRLSDWDRQVLARVSAFHDAAAPFPCRYIAVEPGPRALNHPIRIAASLATQPGPAR